MSLRTQLPSQPEADVAVSAAPGTVLLSSASKHKCSGTVLSVQGSSCATQPPEPSPLTGCGCEPDKWACYEQQWILTTQKAGSQSR